MASAAMATAGVFSSTVDIDISDEPHSGMVNTSSVHCVNALIGPSEAWFWIDIVLFTIFTLGSGLYSGLTTSFFSQDITKLEVCIRQGTSDECVYARRVMRLLNYPNLLIVTLNLGNVAAIVCQPVVLGYIISPALSILVSAITVFVFNKLLPQLIGDRYGLALAANMTWFVYLSIAGFFIIACPIAMLLSAVMGKRKERFYERSELKALIELQMTSPDAIAENKSLSADEVLIIKGALDAESKVARDAMIPLDKVSMLSYDGVFDRKTMQMLASQRFSHVPVFKDRRENVRGEFVMKHLILLDPDNQTPIAESFDKYGRSLNYIPSDKPLYEIFDDMNRGRYRIAAVYANYTGDVIGVLMLQNILDVILGQTESQPLGRQNSRGRMRAVQSWKQLAIGSRISTSAVVEDSIRSPTEGTLSSFE